MIETLKQWDRDLFIYLNSLGIEKFDGFWIFITQIESWIPLFILFFLLIFYYYGFKKGFIVTFFLIVTLFITLAFTDFVKEYIQRLRPNNVEAFSKLIRVLQKPINYSFFSGHASTSFAVSTFVTLSLRRFTHYIYFVFIWPVLFVLSRIFVGVHYPSDLFVGALVGTLIAFIMYFFFEKVIAKMEFSKFR